MKTLDLSYRLGLLLFFNQMIIGMRKEMTMLMLTLTPGYSVLLTFSRLLLLVVLERTTSGNNDGNVIEESVQLPLGASPPNRLGIYQVLEPGLSTFPLQPKVPGSSC